MLPGWMSGLGIQANVTFMHGGVQNEDGTSTTPDFPGMSKKAYNIVGLYEYDKLSARLAYSWRDKFVAEYNYRGCCDLIVDPIKFLDASVSYKLTKDVTVSVDANNLLNFAYHDYHGTPQAPRDVRRYDRTVGVSLRWKM
jgi:TonB-dependent receptor